MATLVERQRFIIVNEQSCRRGVSAQLRTGLLVAFAILVLPVTVLRAGGSANSTEANDGAEKKKAATVDAARKEQPGPARRSEQHVKFAESLDALGRVLETPEFKRSEGPKVEAATRMLFRLNGLPAHERYELLKSWTLPPEGGNVVRSFIGLLTDAPPPEVFMRAALPRLDDPMISTMAMLVDAARTVGKLAELESAAQPFINRNCEEARLLSNFVELAQQGDANTRPRLSSLLDEAEIERQLNLAQRSANFPMVLWCYRAKALAALDRMPGTSLKPTSDPGLKHWVPVDLAEAANCNPFSSTSWWVALDDRIGHVCSPWVDHLVFAYPLVGTFQISGESVNEFWSEGNFGFGGIMFETFNLGTQSNQIYPISKHETLIGRKPKQVRGFNRVTINVEPRRMKVLVNDVLMFDDDDPSPTGPFLMVRTTWLSAFRKLQITGQPVIPRDVALLAGERMDGWMSSFYNESQPPELTLRQQHDGANAVTRNNDPNAYDWMTSEGVLHGRHMADTTPPNRQTGFQHGESWLYYHRPLRENERISYEFYYQPGAQAVEVHPTFDRLALLLHPSGVKLHWLTTNRTQEQGTGWITTDNLAEEPGNRRGPKELPLKLNAWNKVVVEVWKGTVRLHLNNQLIFERAIDSNWGSRFGLYHDRTRSSARVRNVVLSGDWPQWSPELAASLLERIAPLSPTDADAIRSILTPRLTTDD